MDQKAINLKMVRSWPLAGISQDSRSIHIGKALNGTSTRTYMSCSRSFDPKSKRGMKQKLKPQQRSIRTQSWFISTTIPLEIGRMLLSATQHASPAYSSPQSMLSLVVMYSVPLVSERTATLGP